MTMKVSAQEGGGARRAWARTSGENIVVDQDVWWPARAVNKRIPRFLDRRTLNPNEEGTQSHGNIHRHDDEPHHHLQPSLRQAEQGEGETRLGPYGCGEGKCAGKVDDFEQIDDIGQQLRGHVPDVVSITELNRI